MSKDLIIQEICKPETYLFKNYRQQLINEGVDKNDPLIATLDILLTQTYASLAEKQLKLDNKYLKKLKVLTILSCFYGNQSYPLSHLQKELGSSRQECLNLLVEASIYKLITVRIDQAHDSIQIIKCKIREREGSQEIEKYLKGKFIQIKQRNNYLESSLKGILKDIGAAPVQPEEEETKFDIGSLLRSLKQESSRY